MKKLFLLSVLFLFAGVFANSADLIILKDGSTIEAKVTEISPTEIRYKRASNLNGPTVVLPRENVLSIRYENGETELMSGTSAPTPATPPASVAPTPAPPTATSPTTTPPTAATSPTPETTAVQSAVSTVLSTTLLTALNTLPAIPIAGNNLKFVFDTESWTATLNGENFSTGTIEISDTEDGSILTLKQTHIWPGAAGKTVGRLSGRIPGAGAVGSAANAAGNVAGNAGPVEMSGPDIVLEYKGGTLSLSKAAANNAKASTKVANEKPPKPEKQPKPERAARPDRPDTLEMDPDKLTVGFSLEPTGFLAGGPSVSLELTKGKLNTQFHVSFPTLVLNSPNKGFGFGVGVGLNYFHHTRVGGFYIGPMLEYNMTPYTFLAEYSNPYAYYDSVNDNFIAGITYEDKKSQINDFILAMSIGYKFITNSGIYFRTGISAGGKFSDIRDPAFFYRPDIAAGYSF